MKTITGRIKDGKITMEAEGFSGSACIETTRQYLEALGVPEGSGDVQFKDAYHQAEVQVNQ